MKTFTTTSLIKFHTKDKGSSSILNLLIALFILVLFSTNVASQFVALQSNENYFSPATFDNEKPRFKINSDGVIGNSGVRYSISASSAMPPPGADLDQIRNGAGSAGTGSGTSWVNGNAGASNAHYAEGWSIAYRMRLENLVTTSHTLVIEWDIRHSSKNAIDFITQYQNLDEPAGSHLATFGHTEETINPISGISGLGAAKTFPITKPPLSDAAGATFDLLAGKGKEVLTIWGGEITSISYVHGNLSAASSSTQLTINFTTTGSTAVIAWGGHIATRFDWGEGNSAGAVSGSPYHTRLISFDGSGGNQDRSLSAAAVVVPPPPCPVLTAQTVCPEANSIVYSYTPQTGVSYAWSLTDNTAGAAIQGANASGVFTTTGGTVTVIPSGTDFTSGGSFDLSVVMTKAGTANVTCAYDEIGTIYPAPTVTDPSDRTHCNNDAATAISFSGTPTGVTFAWTSTANVGFGTSGTSNIAAYTATNATSSPVTATVTVTPSANGCTGTVQTFTVTVNPTPTVDNVTDRTHCNGAAGTLISFSTPTTGGTATYAWTSTANVGFGTSGTGNIAAYTATNTTSAPVTATVSVKATINGCEGPAETFTVTVNPTPTVDNVTDRTHCNGAAGTLISFSTPTTGGTATYAWTSTANVGFGTSGTGNIAAYTATNTTSAPVTATVSVKATINGCEGPAETFTVTVNPTPTVDNVTDRTHCNGAAGTLISFSTPTTGGTATYAWTSTANVGFGTSGTGNIAAYTATNTTSAPVTATVSVKATINGCEGPAETFTVTVNPTPTVDNVTDRTHCNGAAGTLISFSTPTTGGTATYAWTSTANVGFGTSGTGNIAAYTATNTTSAPVTATVSVKATINGCEGPAETFTITVNPTPPAPAVVYNAPACDAATFSVTVGSAGNPVIAGASYTIVDKNGNAIAGVSPASPHVATASEATNGFSFSNIPAGSGFKVSVSNLTCGSGDGTCGTPSANRLRTTEVIEATIQPKTPTSVLAAPNPFNDRIRFSLQSAISGQGSLELYNMLGQKVKVVYQGYIQKGVTRIFEYNVPGSQRANLIYVFRVGDERVTGKLIGIK